MAKVKRSQLRHFLKTATGPDVWSLVGPGVITALINYNPEVTTETYIHEDVANIDVERYAPTMPIEATAINGDAVFEFVDNLRRTMAVLSDAETEMITVDLYETPVSGDQYPALKQTVSIQVDSFGGDGGASAKINYTINFKGAAVDGTYDLSASTFTPTP